MPEETEEGKRKQKKSKKIKPNPLQSCRTLQLKSEHNTALQIQIYIYSLQFNGWLLKNITKNQVVNGMIHNVIVFAFYLCVCTTWIHFTNQVKIALVLVLKNLFMPQIWKLNLCWNKRKVIYEPREYGTTIRNYVKPHMWLLDALQGKTHFYLFKNGSQSDFSHLCQILWNGNRQDHLFHT